MGAILFIDFCTIRLNFLDTNLALLKQVWASGFSAAFLKKSSVATKGSASSSYESNGINISQPKPAATETALLLVLEKFFAVILNLPKVNR